MSSINDKLLEWGFSHLIPIFQEQEIDDESLLHLSENNLKEIIPKIGPRLKFMANVEKYKISIQNAVDNNSQLMSKQDNDDSSSTLDLRDNYVELSKSSDSESTSVPKFNRATSFHGMHDVERSLGLQFPNFDLKNLLTTSPYGKAILKFYEINNILNDSSRSKLVDIIIKTLYKYILQHRLTHDQYVLLCTKVTDLFPNESASAYYIPYTPKRNSKINKGILAKGRFVDKVRNLLFLSGDTIRHKMKRKLSSSEDDMESSSSQRYNETLQESVTFLKHYREPWNDVIKKWKETFEIRRLSKKNTVSEFIEEWPVLQDLRAEQLINLDFEVLYKENNFKLLENWETFISKIILIEGTSKIKDARTLEFLNNTDEISEDCKHFNQINLMCHLIPPKGRIRISKAESWKFSTAECLESIIVVATCAAEVEEVISKQKERASLRIKESKRKILQGVQPYILIVGNGFTNVESVFLVIDTIRYQFKSIIKSFDTLFKIFHVFRATYPVQSEHIWMLIQRSLYKIKDKDDKQFPSIMHLMKNLE